MKVVPVLILDGNENALSLAHVFHKRKIPVTLITGASNNVLHSRLPFQRIARPSGHSANEHFKKVLLDNPPVELSGAVIFACSDVAIEFICAFRQSLEKHYRLDIQNAELQPQLLDKRTTLELAAKAGVATSAHRRITSIEDLDALLAGELDIQFPAIIKPVFAMRFREQFSCKLFVVNDFDECASKAREAIESGHELILTELIPGPDTLLSSYYTHMDNQGRPLFHFTKRVIRRSPIGFGAGAYHETQWLPDTATAGLKFFTGVGLRGLGNVEFKLDPRDGELKLIECNARITAANQIAVAAGMDMAGLIYDRLLGKEPSPPAFEGNYRNGVTLWYPELDFDAFREMKANGDITLLGWLKTLARPQNFPLFRINDPAPALTELKRSMKVRLGRKLFNANSD